MGEKPIVVSKVGADHTFTGKNRQDFGIMFNNVKLSLDGCSSGEFSEVGVGLFAQALSKRTDITASNFDHIVYEEMKRLVKGLGFTEYDLFQNFCFTIIAAIETETDFTVYSCGDGYVFAINNTGELEILNLDAGYDNYPPYFIYNFISPENLTDYKEGVRFEVRHFSKEKYQNVGIGSDGYQYSENLNNEEKIKLNDAMKAGKPGVIGRIINRNANIFKDDITIVL